MHKKITCIDLDDFLAEFMPGPTEPLPPSGTTRELRSSKTDAEVAPSPPPSVNPLQGLDKFNTEKDMYLSITDALNNAGICPGYLFASTPHKGDASDKSGQAIDCGLYPGHAADFLELQDGRGHGRTDWSYIEIGIECKMNATDDDPFDEEHEHQEPNAVSRRHVLGQILAYAELIFQRQHRTFQYMILFLGDQARIVRIDRSGIFATKKFNYREHGLKLAWFLWRYASLSLALRGHDTTAERIHPGSTEGKRMQNKVRKVTDDSDDYIGKAFKSTLDFGWPWWKLAVPDEATGKTRYFLVGKPHFQAPGVVGRTTRGYIALEHGAKRARFVYLKDAWRVVNDEIKKEGDTLRTLREYEVQYVPTLICHGDIPGQETTTQAVWPRYHEGQVCKLKTHQHYRLAVEEVGKPLEQFDNGYQLVLAVWHCLAAHRQAYLDAGIIHRDISAGNLLIYCRPNGEWTGLLNDWELSKDIAQQQAEEGRQPDRTGTWQFMSVKALNKNTKTIDVPDELESFLHVLLYIALRLLPHNCATSAVPRLLHQYFDDFAPFHEEYFCGPLKQTVIQVGYFDIQSFIDKNPGSGSGGKQELIFYLDKASANDDSDEGKGSAKQPLPPVDPTTGKLPIHPIDGVIRELLKWFSAYYAITSDTPISSNAAPDREEEEQVSAQVAAVLAAEAEMEARAERLRKKKAGSSSAAPEPLATDTVSPTSDIAESTEKVSMSQEALESLAKKVASHDAMAQLLSVALKQKKWPDDDRCTDKKPKKGYVPPDQVPEVAFVPGSRKRKSQVVDDDPPATPPRPSKRSIKA